ncbi:hypothetical protein Tco_0577032 [Tanacetum coccineum]
MLLHSPLAILLSLSLQTFQRYNASVLICPKLLNQEFNALPSDEEIVSFIKELGHKGDIKSVYNAVVDHMYQPWRTFASIINNYLYGKITGLDKMRRQELKFFREYTPGVSVSKKKAPENAVRSKGGSSEGADFESEVLDEPKGKSVDTSEGTGLKLGVLDVSKDDEDVQDSDDEPQYADDERTASENQETNDDEEETEDEFIHTPPNNVPTNDETNDESNDVDEEEYDRIDKELYGDVNIRLKDSEHKGEGKDNEKMTDVDHVHVVVENVDQEGVGSSISSDYAAKFLNFDNIPPADTEVIFMMDIYVQHEVPHSETLADLQLRVIDLEKDVKELKDVDNSTQMISTIKFEVPNAVKEYLGSSLNDAPHKVIQKNFPDIIKEYSVPAETVERLRQQYAPQKTIKDIREIKMEQAREQQVPKVTITSSDTTIQKTTLFETMTKSKLFNKSPKHRALYHDLMESILKDEDAMDEGVTDKLKKGNQMTLIKIKALLLDQTEGKSLATSLKSSKTSKSAKDQVVEPISLQDSDNAEHDDVALNYADMTIDQGEDLDNTDEQPKNDWYKKSSSESSPDPEWNEGKSVDDGLEKSWLNDMAKATKPPLTFDELMHTPIEFSTFISSQASTTKSNATRYELHGIEDMVPNLWSPHNVYSTKRILSITSVKVNERYGYGHLEEIIVKSIDQQLYIIKEGDFKRRRLNDIEDMLLLIVQNKLNNLDGNVIVHLAASLRMFARRMIIQEMVEDLQLGVESYQKKLNITI